MELLQFKISTHRLLLQPISMEYKADIFREFTQEVTTYLSSKPSKKIQDTEIFINQSLLKMEKGEELVIVILNLVEYKISKKQNSEFC